MTRMDGWVAVVNPDAVGGTMALVALDVDGWMVVAVDPADVKKKKKKTLLMRVGGGRCGRDEQW